MNKKNTKTNNEAMVKFEAIFNNLCISETDANPTGEAIESTSGAVADSPKAPKKRTPLEEFMEEALGNKKAEIIPGLSASFEGATYAYQVVGHYLIISKNQEKFTKWLENYGVTGSEAKQCMEAVDAKCEMFIDLKMDQ